MPLLSSISPPLSPPPEVEILSQYFTVVLAYTDSVLQMLYRSDSVLDNLRRNLYTFSCFCLGLFLGLVHPSTPSKMGIQCSRMVVVFLWTLTSMVLAEKTNLDGHLLQVSEGGNLPEQYNHSAYRFHYCVLAYQLRYALTASLLSCVEAVLDECRMAPQTSQG